MLTMGTATQIQETWRHEKKEPSKKIINIPVVVEMPSMPFKTPRIDGSLKRQALVYSNRFNLLGNT